jgi:hypothetical protein
MPVMLLLSVSVRRFFFSFFYFFIMRVFFSDSVAALFLEASLPGSSLLALSFALEFSVLPASVSGALPAGWSLGPSVVPGSLVFSGGWHLWPEGLQLLFVQSSPGVWHCHQHFV